MKPPSRNAAFTLVEVVLALGVMAFCLVPLFGLLPVGLNSNQIALEQTAAAGVASSVAADLRQTPGYVAGSANYAFTHPKSPRFLIPVPNKAGDPLTHTSFFTEDGTVAGTSGGTVPVDQDTNPAQNPRYRVSLTFVLPNTPQKDRTATLVRVLVTWPALADPSAATAPTNFSGSFETMIALDRN